MPMPLLLGASEMEVVPFCRDVRGVKSIDDELFSGVSRLQTTSVGVVTDR